MLAYIGRRALLAVFTVWAISMLAFVIIQLPPGDYVSSYIAQMAATGSVVSDEEAENLRIQYGLGQPIYVQYWKWMKQIAEGNFGFSMEWRRPVTEVIGERLWLTVVVAVAALLLTWVLALPIGIYSAVRQYSVGDYTATFIGFIGLAVPNFLLALVILYFGFTMFNANIGGLFSPELQDRVRPGQTGWSAATGGFYYGLDAAPFADARRFDQAPTWFTHVAAAPTLQLIEEIGVAAIHDHDVTLANRSRAGLGLAPAGSAIAFRSWSSCMSSSSMCRRPAVSTSTTS